MTIDPLTVEVGGVIMNVAGQLRVRELGVQLTNRGGTASNCQHNLYGAFTSVSEPGWDWYSAWFYAKDGVYVDYDEWASTMAGALDGLDANVLEVNSLSGDLVIGEQLPGLQAG